MSTFEREKQQFLLKSIIYNILEIIGFETF